MDVDSERMKCPVSVMVGQEVQASVLVLDLSNIFSGLQILTSTMGDEPYVAHIEATLPNSNCGAWREEHVC